MKKLLTTNIAFIACIFLYSCSSSVSITKRHYTQGYYVESVQKVPTPTAKEETPKVAQQKEVLPLNPSQNLAKQSTADNSNSSQSHKAIPVPASAKSERASHKVLSKVGSKAIFNQITTFSKSPVVQTKLAMSDAITQDGDDGARAALSLLWIVIVVILILWLIGILAGGFGLGPFINLLLLIALILLILWLLRIV